MKETVLAAALALSLGSPSAFAAETADACYLCEPKAADEMTDPAVQAKARAAVAWCQRATEHGGGKPWRYLLIPHDKIDGTKTLAGLAAAFKVTD